MNKITYLRKAGIISTRILWYPMAEYICESASIWVHRINNDCKKRVNTWGKQKEVYYAEGKMASQIDSFALIDYFCTINLHWRVSLYPKWGPGNPKQEYNGSPGKALTNLNAAFFPWRNLLHLCQSHYLCFPWKGGNLHYQRQDLCGQPDFKIIKW